MNWIIFSIAIFLSSCFYRMGGLGEGFIERNPKLRWMRPFVKSIWRDAGCSAVFAVYCCFIIELDIKTDVCIFLSTSGLWGALSTYFKSLFGGEYGEKLGWPNYLVHGAFIGISSLPMAFTDIGIWPVLLRIPVVAGLVCGFGCIKTKYGWPSELLRGASIIATLIIFEVI